jgi:FkbM family methyltransferase
MSTFLSQTAGAVKKMLPPRFKKKLKRLLGIPQTRLHPDWKILSRIGPIYEPHIVLDVGAHHGWFFHCWQDWCPEAIVHAFEPSPAAFDAAVKYYGSHPNVKINQVGIGNCEGTMDLHMMDKSDVSNSFLHPAMETWTEVQFEIGNISRSTVEITTINNYCAKKAISNVYLMKIDVQGFELEVLQGASNILASTDYIFVEAGIQPFYEGAPAFTDVYSFIVDRGFHLIGMRAWHRGNYKLMETDMLFRRNGLLTPIDPKVVKIMEGIG